LVFKENNFFRNFESVDQEDFDFSFSIYMVYNSAKFAGNMNLSGIEITIIV
jgi:hypothetical protein